MVEEAVQTPLFPIQSHAWFPTTYLGLLFFHINFKLSLLIYSKDIGWYY
jgi:hypothetical protein